MTPIGADPARVVEFLDKLSKIIDLNYCDVKWDGRHITIMPFAMEALAELIDARRNEP